MTFKSLILAIAIMAVLSSMSHASDPSPLQDFCVAVDDTKNAVFVNGKFCKDPKLVVAEDFFKSGLNMLGNTSNNVGSAVTPVNVNNLLGLNTLGISLARIDYAPYSLNPPHTHPRGTEFLVVLEGTLYVGFVLSNPGPNMKNKLFTKILHPGDVFVFPIDPPINDDVLTKAFQIENKVVDYLQSQFWILNTLGISLSRIDYASYGLNPPHTHPRGTEFLVVLEGTLYAGFVLSNPGPNMKNKLFTKILHLGDVFFFPIGLIHFQFNPGKTKTVAFAGLSSQNPGVITIANAVFGSDPPISDDVLAKAFQIDKK
ncbi:hypothetical protein H5410_014523, partial [Solanum commersonii]